MDMDVAMDVQMTVIILVKMTVQEVAPQLVAPIKIA